MNNTKIEWCDLTINPVVGCSKCSPGCDNCYAERFAARLAKNPKTAAKYAGVVNAAGKWTGKINGIWMHNIGGLHDKKRPKRIFMGSMGDFFHDGVSDDMLFKMFAFAALCPQHTFIFLTKRPERMRNFMTDTSTRANDRRGREYRAIGNILDCDTNMDGLRWPLSNVWLGVTVCNQSEADEKILILLQTPAAKRFVSVEPMLGPVDLDKDEFLSPWRSQCDRDLPFIDWVICGGETGPNARPMHHDWVISLRDQCEAANVPFFFKGWGAWLPTDQWHTEPVGKSVIVYEDGSVSAKPESRGRHYARTYAVNRPENALFYGEEIHEVPS